MRVEGLLVLGAGALTAAVTESPIYLVLGTVGCLLLLARPVSREERSRAILEAIEACPPDAKELLGFAAVLVQRLSEERTQATDARRVARIDGALASALRVANDYRTGRLAGPAPAEALTDELLSVERRTT